MGDVVDLNHDPNQNKIVRGLRQAVEGQPARVTTYAVCDGEAIPVERSGFGDADGTLASMDVEAFLNIRYYGANATSFRGPSCPGDLR